MLNHCTSFVHNAMMRRPFTGCASFGVQDLGMEEEGTVVYFKSSPICDLHEDEELVYREEWDSGGFEAASSEDDRRHPTVAHGCGDRIHSATSPSPSSASQGAATVWKSRGAFLRFFDDMWAIGKRWLHPTDQIVGYRERLLDCIANSPLLTEDDFQLVQFIVSNQTHRSTAKHHSQPHKNSHLHPKNNRIILFLTALLVSLIAIATVLLPIQYIFLVLSTLAILTGVPLTLKWRMKLALERRLEKSVDSISTYLSSFETLLSLVTQTTRLIRETEIIAHGFSRPSGAVPITKLELQGSTELQCPLLRKKLFSVCQDGIRSLRRATQQLCTEFSTREEFDCCDGYLAFRELSFLHQFMRVEGVSAQGETKDAPSFDTLESLKDASNLLAVQNSELLKRLAVVICFAAENHDDQNESSIMTLVAAMETISSLHSFLHEASDSLRWSVDFHKNYLFGEPPAHKRVVIESEGASPTTTAHPLKSTVHEVHCMDLKTQVALQRVRALGSWLGEQCATPPRAEQGGETVTVSESVESFRQQLSTIEYDVQGIVDHIAVCYQNLDSVDAKPGDVVATLKDSPESKGVSTDFTEGEEAMAQVAPGAEEECCSDDEMVFEAYVSPSDVIEDQDDLPLDAEDAKSQRESKENSISMLKELNSVLAVRNIEKQRKRELRERKKQGGLLSVTGCNIQEKPMSPSSRAHGILEEEARETEIVDGDLENTVPTEGKLSPENKSHRFDLPVNVASRDREERFGDNPAALDSSSIAQAVAAIALRAGRANKEELFHDDQDSIASSSTSEAETDQP